MRKPRRPVQDRVAARFPSPLRGEGRCGGALHPGTRIPSPVRGRVWLWFKEQAIIEGAWDAEGSIIFLVEPFGVPRAAISVRTCRSPLTVALASPRSWRADPVSRGPQGRWLGEPQERVAPTL